MLRTATGLSVLLVLAACGASNGGPNDGGGGQGGGASGGAGGSAAGGGAGGSALDGGSVPDSGIVGTPNVWHFVRWPEARCADGSPAGLGFNLSGKSNDLLVLFSGAGACWDKATCYTLHTAPFVDGPYADSDFSVDTAIVDSSGILSRTDAQNPFKNANYIFVPYCTGDLFFGTHVATYDSANPTLKTHHVGATNTGVFLEHLKATFSNPQKVWVAGYSSGGFGATLNFPAFRAAFPSSDVALLADSAPMVPAAAPVWSGVTGSWAMPFPSACADCAQGFDRYIAYLVSAYPSSRLALAAYDQDKQIRNFFGLLTSAAMLAATNTLLSTSYLPGTKAQYFVLKGESHMMLPGYSSLAQPDGGITLKAWVSDWATGASTWKSVRE